LARGKSAVTCSLLSGKNEIYRGSLESADTVRGARLLVTAQNKVIAPFNTAETRSDLELAGLKTPASLWFAVMAISYRWRTASLGPTAGRAPFAMRSAVTSTASRHMALQDLAED